MRIQVPKPVQSILETLTTHGYEAYAVGGCVRDALIGRTPNDWDVTTSAKPEEVKDLFRRTVDTGIQHGTVTVMIREEGYEVTTFRIDGKYSDNRHPESVTFTPSLQEDLKRRDFTINAMAYNDWSGIVDLYGGREDLDRRIIRAVGVPLERFSEDALRIMRCIRFAAQLNFDIDPATLAAAKELSGNLEEISRERVREELLKILESDHPEYVSLLREIGGMESFYPEFSEYEAENAALLQAVPKDRVQRLAALFYRAEEDCPKLADRILLDLKFDNDTRKKVVSMLAFTKESPETDSYCMRRLLAKYGEEPFEEMMSFFETARGTSLEGERQLVSEILERGDCISLKTLQVNGGDLIRCGVKPGPGMGAVLEKLFDEVLQHPENNRKETLLGLVQL